MFEIKRKLRKVLWKFGVDVSPFTPLTNQTATFIWEFARLKIDLVLDVGANAGQFGQFLRQAVGYSGRIVSFEPLSSAFSILKAKQNANWSVLNLALGEADEFAEINVSQNSYSSSLLQMLPTHLESAPNSRYRGKERVEVCRLDSIFEQVQGGARSICLKIDTQGFEGRVLRGAAQSLPKIDMVQMEMSLLPLYDDGWLFADLHDHLLRQGFGLVGMFPTFWDEQTRQWLQVDGTFRRLSR